MTLCEELEVKMAIEPPHVYVTKLLKFHNCIIWYGVNGEIGSAIHKIWIPDTVTDGNEMYAFISFLRCLDIKLFTRLCDDNMAP